MRLRSSGLPKLIAAAVLCGWLPAATAGAQVRMDPAALAAEIAREGGRVIIGLRPGPGLEGMLAPGVRAMNEAAQAAIADQLESLGLRVERRFRLIVAVSGRMDTVLLTRLLAHPNVEYVEPDWPRTLAETGEVTRAPLIEVVPWGVSTIRAPEAWAVTTPPNYGAGVKVAIVDDGGDSDHQDLLFAGGFDVTSGSASPSAWDNCDGFAHGTHVAGIVGARRGNDVGYVGVAPDAALYAVKVFELEDVTFNSGNVILCTAYTSSLIAGLDWAVSNGMQVVNMSLGGYSRSESEARAVQAAAAAGVHLVAAAGNNNFDQPDLYPAAFPEVIAVGATNIADIRASFSNRGPELAVVAPGVDVPSTFGKNTYVNLSGTSMASPHVAGVVALLVAQNPSITRDRVRELLRDGALDLGSPGKDALYGDGRVDALNSVGLLVAPPRTATQLAITRPPGGAVTGGPFAIQPVVQLRDANNLSVTQAEVVVSAAVASGPGSLVEATSATTNANGVATFHNLTITGEGDHTLEFSAPGLSSVTSAVFTVSQAQVTALQDNTPVPGLAGVAGSQAYYVFTVPATATQLQVSTSGGTGNADIYLRQGQLPTLDAYQCRPFLFGNTETCTIDTPAADDWYVMLRGVSSYSGASLVATYQTTRLAITGEPGGALSGAPFTAQPVVRLQDRSGQPVAQAGVLVTATRQSGPGALSGAGATTDASGVATFSDLTITGVGMHALRFSATGFTSAVTQRFGVAPPAPPISLQNGTPLTGLAASQGSNTYYVITVPAAATPLEVRTSGGYGDVDMFLFRGSAALGQVRCTEVLTGNSESCTIANPAPGDWTVLLYGFRSYEGVTLVATYAPMLTVAVAGRGSGIVSSGPAGISCVITAGTASGACGNRFPFGSPVLLAATEVGGSGFTGWGETCAGTGPCTVPMLQDRTVTATFTARFSLTVLASGNGAGTVASQAGLSPAISCIITAGVAGETGCTASYLDETSVALSATLASGSLFGGWSGTGADCSLSTTCTLSVGQPLNLGAAFLVVAVEAAEADLLGTPRLTTQEQTALDQAGNRNGTYDVGDYLAMLDRSGLNPSAERMARIQPSAMTSEAERQEPR